MSDGSHEIERIRREEHAKKIEERTAIYLYREDELGRLVDFRIAETKFNALPEDVKDLFRLQAKDLLTTVFHGG